MTETQPHKPLKGSAYWNVRYREDGFAYGEIANDFLQACATKLSCGKALSLIGPGFVR